MAAEACATLLSIRLEFLARGEWEDKWRRVIAVLERCWRIITKQGMDVQIASTLKVLSQSGRDKNVQVRGLRFLLDSCKEGLDCEFRWSLELDDNMLASLPIVETVSQSIRDNSTVKAVVTLGCHCSIAYSRFRGLEKEWWCLASCQRCFVSQGLIKYLCGHISRLASESVLSLELAVLSTYGSSGIGTITCWHAGCVIPDEQLDGILQTLLKIEKRWQSNVNVIQQMISNFSVLAEHGPSRKWY